MTTSEIRHMRSALAAAAYSEDPSVQNGAFIVRYGRALTWSFNTIPFGVQNSPERWERPAKYAYVEHAERNAIFLAAKQGMKTKGADMFCPWAACAECSRAIVQSGISRLYRFPMPHNERWSDSILIGDEILREGGVRIVEMSIEEVGIPEGLRLGQFVS